MILKKKSRCIVSIIMCMSLMAALTDPYSAYIRKAEAFSAGTTINEEMYLTENEIKDTTLLSVLRVIAGYTSEKSKNPALPDLTGEENLLSDKYSGYSKSSFTFGELKAYTGPINLTPYADKISSIEGLGYARGACSFDLGACSKITSIPAEEFGKCAMSEIILPSALTAIGDRAFQQSENLMRIIISGKTYDDGVVADLSNIKKIGDHAFDGCKSLDNIKFYTNPSLTIGVSAFSNCTSLASVVLPMSNANNLGESVFSGCSSLTEVSFNNSLSYIPSNAFSSTAIEKVIITGQEYSGTNYMPAGITYIGQNAFQGAALRSGLDFTKCSRLSRIEEYAFAQASISSLLLPKGVEKIYSNAFNATFLLSLDIPDSVNYLGTDVFRGSALCNISISPNITELPKGTFRECLLLSDITLRGTSSSPCKLKSIGDYAFYKCCSLGNTDFLSGASRLESIGEYAFSECSLADDSSDKDIYGKVKYSGISDVTLPDNVTSIGKNAFSENYSLETVNLGAGIKVVPQEAFYVKSKDESALKKVILSDKLTRIENSAFSNNGILGTIGYTNGTRITCEDGSAVFAGSLEYIGDSAFSGCSSKQMLNNLYNNYASIMALEYTMAKKDIHTKKQSGDSEFLVYYGGDTKLSKVYIPQSVIDSFASESYTLDDGTPSDTIYIMAKHVWTDASSALQTKEDNGRDDTVMLEVLDISNSYGYEYFINDVHKTEVPVNTLSDTGADGNDGMYVLFPGSTDTYDSSNGSIRTITPAFYQGLTHVILPDSLADPALTDDTGEDEPEENNALGKNIFSGDFSLDTVDMSRNIKVIPENMFNGCADRITDWATYETIEYGYTGLNHVNNIDNITDIGDSAFCNCYNLKLRESNDGGEISYNLVNIGNDAFYNCKNIKSVVFHSALKTIGNRAFMMCSETNSSANYEYIADGNKVTYSYTEVIPPADADGLGLSDVDFTYATNLETIGSEAFSYNALTVVNLPDALFDTVPYGLFRGCSYLETVTIPKNVKSVSNNSFTDCRSLKKLHIPATSEISDSILTGHVPESIPGLQMIVDGETDYRQSVPVGGSICLPINCMSSNTRNGVNDTYTITVFENNDDTDGTVIYNKNGSVNGDSYDDILDASIEYDNEGKPDRIMLHGMKKQKKNIILKVQTSSAFHPFGKDNYAIINSQTFTYNVDVSVVPATDMGIECTTDNVDIISERDASGAIVNSLYLYQGQNSVDLTASLIPSHATDECKWSFVNPGIISLELKESEQGVSNITVTPLHTGNTKITVKCGQVTKDIYVYVKVPLNGLTAETESTGATSSFDNIELPAGGTDKITVMPSYDRDLYTEDEWKSYADTIIFSSDNEDVVKVDTSGNITAVAEGSATVTVKALSTGLSITYNITVVNPAEYNLYIGKSIEEITGAKDIYTGESVRLGAVLYPAKAANKIKWSVTQGDAAIDNNGLLTAGNTPGDLYVQAVMLDADGNETSVVSGVTVKVLQHADSIAFTGTIGSAYKMYVGETLYISKTTDDYSTGYRLFPETSTDSVTCKSSDESVVSVEDDTYGNYTITALKGGRSVITITSSSGAAASFTADIINGITGITLPQEISVTKGSVTQLTPVITPADSNDTITWSSSDEKVVTVDGSGVITAHGAGSAEVTARSPKGAYATTMVTVTITADIINDITGITLPQTISVTKGSVTQLTPIITPAGSNDTITWTSSDEKMVTVDSLGVITAHGAGSAEVTARSSKGAYATIMVTVIIPATKLSFRTNTTQKTLYMCKNSTADIALDMEPSDSTDTITYSSSNPSVAEVSGSGNQATITSVKKGSVRVTATSSSGTTASITVKVVKSAKPAKSIKISGKSYVDIGGATDLTAKLTQKTSTDTVTWSSSNGSVASVDDYGRVTGIKKGEAHITAMTTSGKKAVYTVYVAKKALPQQTIKLSGKKKVKVGKTITIKVKTKHKVAAKKITWTSSNTSIATVKKGRIKGIAKGTAKISASLKSGHSATIKIKVTK